MTSTISKPREEVFEYLADIANHPEFTDHIGIQHGDRADAVGIAAILNAQPIADSIDHGRADTGKSRVLCVVRTTYPGHRAGHQIENVVAHQREL